MNFFDMGILEILLILIVALIIFGPDRIPQIARTIGKTIATLRKSSQDITSQIKKELEIDEPEPPYNKMAGQKGPAAGYTRPRPDIRLRPPEIKPSQPVKPPQPVTPKESVTPPELEESLEPNESPSENTAETRGTS